MIDTSSDPEEIAPTMQSRIEENLAGLDTDPRIHGNVIAFAYFNHNPLCTIGPHCIKSATYDRVQLFLHEWNYAALVRTFSSLCAIEL